MLRLSVRTLQFSPAASSADKPVADNLVCVSRLIRLLFGRKYNRPDIADELSVISSHIVKFSYAVCHDINQYIQNAKIAIIIHKAKYMRKIFPTSNIYLWIEFWIPDLFSGAEAGGVEGGVFGSEAVEAPDECQLEVTGHVVDFHPVVLTGVVDGHGR